MARRLEGKPFHLVATHCQRNSKENVVEYITGKGLSADTPNVTVSSFGGHPKVKGNGYVPYYMVFDHHGELVHHHMCGDYHGGDGLKMIEWVDKLLRDVPAIYLGKEPYVEIPDLAKKVAKQKGLAATVKRIEAELAAEEPPAAARRAELERLRAAVEDYRLRMLKRSDDDLAIEPTAVIPSLQSLLKEFKGTKGEAGIQEKLTAMKSSKELADSVKLYKTYEKTMARLEKSAKVTPKLREAMAKRLEKALKGHESLPVAGKVQAAIERLRN